MKKDGAKKKMASKLHLHRETVRLLPTEALTGILGILGGFTIGHTPTGQLLC